MYARGLTRGANAVNPNVRARLVAVIPAVGVVRVIPTAVGRIGIIGGFAVTAVVFVVPVIAVAGGVGRLVIIFGFVSVVRGIRGSFRFFFVFWGGLFGLRSATAQTARQRAEHIFTTAREYQKAYGK